MKLFAISIGIPVKDIILEEEANSTYENAMYSKDILDKKGIDSLLLVSSPYNMRRTELVFNKHAKGLKVLYLRVKNNQFYDRARGVRIEQIKGIMHEYLGIGYYMFKGYI